MSTQRPERVQEALRQEISKIVQNEMKDPRIGFLTITAVEITKDLRHAKVFFSTLGEMKNKRLALKALISARGYIKGLVGERVKMRYMPQLEFKIDESLERGQKINDILGQIKRERKDE